MGCQSGLAGARFDIKMRLVKSSAFFVDKGIDVDYKRSRCWRVGREARQRTANPSTAVRIRYSPPHGELAERLGRGLQILLQRFESVTRLHMASWPRG